METQTNWMPRPVYEEAAGCVWLPRMLDKARRQLEGERQGKELLWPYMYGDHDYMDALLLKYLGLTGLEVLDILRREPDEPAAIAAIMKRRNLTPEQCGAWSKEFKRHQGPFLAMIHADEGRRAPGLSTALLRLVYNAVILPYGIWLYRRGGRQAQGN